MHITYIYIYNHIQRIVDGNVQRMSCGQLVWLTPCWVTLSHIKYQCPAPAGASYSCYFPAICSELLQLSKLLWRVRNHWDQQQQQPSSQLLPVLSLWLQLETTSA